MPSTPRLEENPIEKTSHPTSSPNLNQICRSNLLKMMLLELKTQRGIALPLVAMNLTWFAKIAITTAFLGRLGELQLAGGTLGFTFANVTGFSVLNGLCGAMEPICGQAYGAKNFRLLHRTLLMAILLLLLASLPIAFLWLNVDKILIHFGQQRDISIVARHYLLYLLPHLLVTSLLCPLKAYLSSQSVTIPIMLSSALALAFHIPVNILLVKARGLEGVSMATWISDLVVVIFLVLYLLVMEHYKQGKWKEEGWWKQSIRDWLRFLKLCGPCCLTCLEWWKEEGWWKQSIRDWLRFLKLCGPCCLTTCLEWWCYEILVLLTGRLTNAKEAVGVLAIVLNFDYLLYSVMLSLATCASTRVSNELGANRAEFAYQSAKVSLGVSIISGCAGALVMVGARGFWGSLFSHDKRIVKGVKRMMLLMAIVEAVNFPLTVCGGIVRGTARPWLAMYANLAGFYLLALPLGVILAFEVALGLGGLLIGFLIGIVVCLTLLVVFAARINWDEEACKAQTLACNVQEVVKENGTHISRVDNNTALRQPGNMCPIT